VSPEARAAPDARDGDRGAGSAPRHEPKPAWTQDLSVSAARPLDLEPNHVWARDLTYIPMARGFLYLVRSSQGDCEAIVRDWVSRAVLGLAVSNTNSTAEIFCVAALERRCFDTGSRRYSIPTRGLSSPSAAFTGRSRRLNVAISMTDAAASWTNFHRRLWRLDQRRRTFI